jgi:mono/diheme cytochrome c family protein
MRGTIDVTGPGEQATPALPPPYVALGLNIDDPHPAAVVPDARPSAARGAALGVDVPAPFLTQDYYRAHSPADVWSDLRAQAFTDGLSDAQVWDLAAWVLRANTTPANLEAGAALFAANCAACHGESGQGDGVMAASRLSPSAGGTAEPGMMGHEVLAPANFTDPATMFGASPALLQGKIVRGGMGTGMPSWGAILTEAQTWLLVQYLLSYTVDLSS